jgi:hypothetical protein
MLPGALSSEPNTALHGIPEFQINGKSQSSATGSSGHHDRESPELAGRNLHSRVGVLHLVKFILLANKYCYGCISSPKLEGMN